MSEFQALAEEMFSVIIKRGFNPTAYRLAVEKKDDDMITILHPWNYLTEEEAEKAQRRLV